MVGDAFLLKSDKSMEMTQNPRFSTFLAHDGPQKTSLVPTVITGTVKRQADRGGNEMDKLVLGSS